MNLVHEIVKTVILSGRVIQDAPVSMLLIAAPERGKTSIALAQPCKAVFALTDVTGKGIQLLCQQSKEITHFVINDMVAVMSHRATVNHFTLSMLNAMTEEGIQAVAYPSGIQGFQNGKRGIIACLTLDLVRDGRCWWNKTGFATRMLPFAYEHSTELQVKIKAAIVSGQYERKREAQELLIPEQPVHVNLSRDFALKIQRLADYKSNQLGKEIGYRRGKQFRSLARAHALMRGTKKAVVKTPDFAFLERISEYISFTECRPL